ncbi:MAG TPA: hypothetical protein VFC03_22215 [Acidimicrobiales bacterium]|nr:hypothetical protein [Acidimicrobiales bacterium]
MMAAELRRCGMCQLMKPDGISCDDGVIFICDQCNADAAEFVAIHDSLYASPEGPDGE